MAYPLLLGVFAGLDEKLVSSSIPFGPVLKTVLSSFLLGTK